MSLSSTEDFKKETRIDQLLVITKWAQGGKEAEIPLLRDTK